MLISDQGLLCCSYILQSHIVLLLITVSLFKFPEVGKHSPYSLKIFCILNFEAIIIARLTELAGAIYTNKLSALHRLAEGQSCQAEKPKIQGRLSVY